MSTRTNAYLKGISSTTLQKILTKIIGLIVTPIVLSYLGQDEYGIWIIIGSFLGYMGLMDIGITGSVTQLIAKNDNKETMKKINIIVNNSFFLQVIIGAIIIVLGIICSFFFPNWFEINPDSKETAFMAFLLAAIGYGISFPPKTLKGLIRGKQQISLSIWLEFSMFLLTTGLNLYFLHLGFGLMSLPIGTIIVRLLSYFVFYKIAKKTLPELDLALSYFKWEDAKSILNVSSVWFIGSMSAVVIYTSDTLIIGATLSTGVVTIYALTFRLSEFLRDLIYTINSTAMPGLGQLAGQGNFERIRSILITMFPFVINITFGATLFVIFFNQEFVRLWVGDKMYGGDDLNLIFGLTLFTTVVFHTFSMILSSSLNLKAVTISRVTEAILNIVISLILVKDYGFLGVALGTIIASLLTSFWIVPIFACRYIKISLKQFFKEFGINIGFPFILTVLYFYLFRYLIEINFNKLLLLFLLIILSIINIWVFGLNKNLKGKILAKIKK